MSGTFGAGDRKSGPRGGRIGRTIVEFDRRGGTHKINLTKKPTNPMTTNPRPVAKRSW